MKELGANLTAVKECYNTEGYALLFIQLLNQAWSPTALMINSVR